jgi:hypothetical protein
MLKNALLLSCTLLLSACGAPKPEVAPYPTYDEMLRQECYGYPSADEALHAAHQQFDDFKGRYSLVREVEPIPEAPGYTAYRLWDDGTWVKESRGKSRLVKAWAEQWFCWAGDANKRLVKGKRLYVTVEKHARKDMDPKKYQAYVRFYTKQEWDSLNKSH